MKVSLKWLDEYVGRTMAPTQLVERLTLAGLEVAGVRVIGLPVPEGLHIKPEDQGPVWDPKKIVVAQVRNVEKHPNADKLKLVTVDYGTGVPKQVVTGAPNINVGDHGQKVILALAGSVLFDGHSREKKLKELKPTEIRGVPSDSMCCSELELGISEEHEGIILLEDDAPVGKPLVDFMGDIVIELDVLPNMARCLSMLGIAREVAALTGGQQPLRYPDRSLTTTSEPAAGQVQVQIGDSRLSRRYLAMLIKGVKIGPAPGWMQRRLTYAGMRPISNIVDITNYVMLEWGQPLHAFDWDILRQRAGGQTPTITVRPARVGEKLVTIDKVERILSPDHLVIADSAGPIALAGVMGGFDTEVSAKTTSVLLESASFDPVSIRRTMKHFNLPSEASIRFSKGIHPDIVRLAAERAAELMRRHAGGKVCQGAVDCFPDPIEPKRIILEVEDVRKVLGMHLPDKEIVQTLKSLEFKVERDAPETLLVIVPPHRLDVDGSADLIEELVRIHGYDKLPASLLADVLPQQQSNTRLVREERTRDILVAAGLQEVITYSLTLPPGPNAEGEGRLGMPLRDPVCLKNPISPERSVMRQTLLNSVLEVSVENLKNTGEVRIFEIGSVYLSQAGQKLPDEPRRLAIVMTGRRHPEFWAEAGAAPEPLDFFDIKGIVETLLGDLHVGGVGYRLAKVPWLHPARAAELLIDGKPAGTFGQLHPQVAGRYGLDPGRIVLAGELDLELLLAAVPDRYLYQAVPRVPAVLRDIAVIVAEEIPADRVVAEMRQAGGNLLRTIRLFDLYRGPQVPPGTRSLAFALQYQSDQVLTDKEVDKVHQKIEGRLRHVLDAKIRGKDTHG